MFSRNFEKPSTRFRFLPNTTRCNNQIRSWLLFAIPFKLHIISPSSSFCFVLLASHNFNATFFSRRMRCVDSSPLLIAKLCKSFITEYLRLSGLRFRSLPYIVSRKKRNISKNSVEYHKNASFQSILSCNEYFNGRRNLKINLLIENDPSTKVLWKAIIVSQPYTLKHLNKSENQIYLMKSLIILVFY